MFQPRSIQSSLSFRDKLLSIDYVLVVSILILGIISMFAMYSTDGGEFKYHTKSHILRFSIFFSNVFYSVFYSNSFLAWKQLYNLSFCFNFIDCSKIFWINIIRISKMVKFIFYESSAFRINENRINPFFS